MRSETIKLCAGSLSRGIMQPVREAVLSSPCNPEVKNVWNFTSTSAFAFLAWFLIKYGVKLVFWFYRMTISNPPVSGADECARDLHKKYYDNLMLF